MSVEDRVKKIVSDQLGTSLDEVNSDSSFVDDLGADSLDTVELVMALEEEFDLEILVFFTWTTEWMVFSAASTKSTDFNELFFEFGLYEMLTTLSSLFSLRSSEWLK